MRARTLLVSGSLAACAAMVASCTPFGEQVDVRPDAGTGAVDAGADASGFDAAPKPPCDGSCPLFEDDFERPAVPVVGSWSGTSGPPEPTIDTAGATGSFLLATLPAGSGAARRSSFLEKVLAPMQGLRLAVSLRQNLIAGGGAYGADEGSSFCTLVSLSLSDDVVAIVYSGASGPGVFLYGPNEMNGVTAATLALGSWTPFALDLSWTNNEVTLSGTAGGATIQPVKRDLKAGLADAAPHLRVGLTCKGQSPAIEAAIDSVRVDWLP